jgi:hypothetical protein
MIGALVAACGLLGACGHSNGNTATPLVKRNTGAGGAGSSAANDADAGPSDLVSAVSGGGEEAAVGLKFQVGQRPVPGHPVVITLRLVANQALDHLEARFRPDEGLEVTQGGDFHPQGHLDAGATVDHDLTLTPDRDGIYTVLATVTTGSADAVVSRSFVIPIVVGAAVAATPVAVPVVGKPTAAKAK